MAQQQQAAKPAPPLTIGLAIPCTAAHYGKLIQLLTSLEYQTRKPDSVVVALSSTPLTFSLDLHTFSYPIQILLTPAHQTAGQNRNVAADILRTDIVSFFDADDSMHPQRLEAIAHAFSAGADVVLHSYSTTPPFKKYDTFNLIANKLVRAPSGCAKIKDDLSCTIHHSQVSVRRKLLQSVRFLEEKRSGTDSIFCGQVLSLPGITSQYIREPLSLYVPSGTLGI